MSESVLAGIRILLVDDDEMVREALCDYFVDCGADVVQAGSARAALAAFTANPPDVLVSDLRMPREDGLWLIGEVRRLSCVEGGRVPAIAVTGDALLVNPAVAAGFDAVHVKPPRLPDLADLVAYLAGVHDACSAEGAR
jgi:CheY-like chemotaxis protein